eukprot:2923234-Rhodomonas_salina.2
MRYDKNKKVGSIKLKPTRARSQSRPVALRDREAIPNAHSKFVAWDRNVQQKPIQHQATSTSDKNLSLSNDCRTQLHLIAAEKDRKKCQAQKRGREFD